MEQNSRFSKSNDPVYRQIENEQLQCGHCAFLIPGNTAACEKYLQKPGYVLCGTQPCPKYQRAEAKEG